MYMQFIYTYIHMCVASKLDKTVNGGQREWVIELRVTLLFLQIYKQLGITDFILQNIKVSICASNST